MEIKRHSLIFTFFFSIATLLMFFVAWISFSAEIHIEDCQKLGLPVLTIDTEGGKKIKSKEKYLKAVYMLYDEDSVTGGNCRIRGRGNTTWETRELYKKPYLLKLDESTSMLGLPAARKWVLMANTADKTQIRNFYAEYLAKNVFNNFKWTPSSNYISLFVNGKYTGLYALTEKIEAVTGRIPIDEENGSFVFEANERMDEDYNFRTESGIPFSIRTSIKNLSSADVEKQKKIIQKAEDEILNNKIHPTESIIDLNSFADWYIINELTKNHDSKFQFSCYFYYDSILNKIYAGPIWDFDISCGNIRWNDCENPEGFWVKNALWMNKLFENSEFTTIIIERWTEKRDELLKSFNWIETTSADLKNAVMLNDAVWKNIGHRQWPHAPGWKTRKTYESEVKYMTDWLNKRFVWMDKAILDLHKTGA